MCFYYVDDFVIPIEVKFANSTFTFHELSGLAHPMLRLNSTSDCCNISVKVKIEDLTAAGNNVASMHVRTIYYEHSL